VNGKNAKQVFLDKQPFSKCSHASFWARKNVHACVRPSEKTCQVIAQYDTAHALVFERDHCHLISFILEIRLLIVKVLAVLVLAVFNFVGSSFERKLSLNCLRT
jgi:hypothetical protein